MERNFFLRIFQICLFLFLFIFTFWNFQLNIANAATRTWTGTSSNLWDVDANWGGTKPVAGDDLIFPASASNKSTSNDIAADTSFNSITFEGTGYTLAGNRISLPAGGITSNISGGSNTMSLNLLLTATTTIAVTNSNETLTISGIISDGGSAFGVNKSGSGQLNLSGNNTFSGDLTILKGTVSGGTSANAFGAGSITLGNSAGGSDDAAVRASSALTYANPIVLASNTTGTLTIGGQVSGGAITFSGGVTGANNLTFDSTYTNGNGLVFSTGSINNTGTVTNSSTGSNTLIRITSVIGTNVTEVIQNSSTGRLQPEGDNTFSGNLTILKGTVQGKISANAFGAGSITLGNSAGGSDDANLEGAASVTFPNPIVLASNTTGTLTVSKSAATVSPVFSGGVTGINNLTITSLGSTGSLTLSTGSINNTGTVTNSGSGTPTVTISSVIGSNITEVIQNSSTSQLTLSGDNTFTGNGLTILKGTVVGSTNATAFGAGSITLGNSAGGSDNATLKSATALTFANPIVLASNTTGELTITNTCENPIFSGGVTGTNNLIIKSVCGSSRVALSGTAVNNIGTITNSGSGVGATAISSSIGSNVTEVIQNSSTSDLSLTGNNTFGTLTIKSGSVTGSNNATAFGAGIITVGDSAGGSNDATLNGFGDLTFANAIVLASNTTGVLTIEDIGGSSAVFSGGVTGDNDFVIKSPPGSATLTFSTGAINNSGIITNTSTGGSSGIIISSVIGSNVTGLVQNSATSPLTLSGNNSTISGDVTITSGTLAFSGTTNLNVSGDWTNNSTFTSNTGTVTFTGSGNSTIVTGGTGTTQDFNNFTVEKTGSGVVQLSTNGLDIDGTLTVTSGTLDLNGQNISTVTTCSNSGTIKLQGDETVSCTPTLNAGSIVEYSATSGTRDIKNWTYDNLVINGSGGTFTSGADETIGTDLTVTEGTLDISDDTFSVGNNVTINGGTITAPGSGENLTLGGNWSRASGTFTPNGGTVTFASSSAQTLTGETFNNLIINNSAATPSDTDDVDSSDAVTITGTLTITDGQFQPTTASDLNDISINTNGILKPDSSATLTVEGDFANSGTFTHNGGTITLDGTTQIFSGVSTFNNLKSITAGNTITFPADITTTVEGTLTLEGADGNNITLQSSGAGTNGEKTDDEWDLVVAAVEDAEGNAYVEYLTVYDSDATGDATPIQQQNSTNGGNNTGWAFDLSAPARTNGSPTGEQALGTTEVTMSLTTDESATCKYGTIADTAYDSIANTFTTTGGTTHSKSITGLTNGSSNTYYVRCSDADSNVNTDDFTITWTVAEESLSGGGGSGGFFRPPEQTEPREPIFPDATIDIELLEGLASMALDIQDGIASLFKREPADTKSGEDGEEITVPEKAPLAFLGNLYFPDRILQSFVLNPLPKSLLALKMKFPEIDRTLSEVGITTVADVPRLAGVEFAIPRLSEVIERKIVAGDLGEGKGIASFVGVPVGELPAELLAEIPKEIVFARTNDQKLDIGAEISITENGEVAQVMSALSGQLLKLFVKPGEKVESVIGYISLDDKELAKAEENPKVSLSSMVASVFLANPKVASEQAREVEHEFVLETFEYEDKEGNGIYEAEVKMPVTRGQYAVKTVITPSDPGRPIREIETITIIDPEGYVFRKVGNQELRIQKATVSLWWKNPETNTFELWPAENFQQRNPQVTDQTGGYSFLVPEGEYYLTVEAEGHETFEGKIFKISVGRPVHENIELRKSGFWSGFLRFFSNIF